jgi:predicted DNA binding protein
LIEAQLSIRIPELWITPVTENYNIELACQVGGSSGKAGWGFVTIKGEESVLDDVVRKIREHPSVGGVNIQARGNGSRSLVVEVVKCKACEVLMKSRAFMVFPVHAEKGRMRWLIVTDGNRTIGRIIDDLNKYGCDVKIERVTALTEKGILTPRQQEVIRTALSAGFFDYPRKADTVEVAAQLGISVSTLSEVIRAAQRRVFSEYVR